MNQRSQATKLPVTLRAKDLMDTNIVSLGASESVATAINKMTQTNVWSIIVERGGLPVGVVTDRDILRRCLAKKLTPEAVTVEKIMTSPIVTIEPGATIGEMMEKMVQNAIRRLYVVENGKVLGRVTQTMLFENSLNVMMSLSSMRYQM